MPISQFEIHIKILDDLSLIFGGDAHILFFFFFGLVSFLRVVLVATEDGLLDEAIYA
jgi:hypothetical protein